MTVDQELNRIQLQLDRHQSQIGKLFSKIDDTNKCILKINTSLMQIKWGVYGALLYYFVTQIGIIEAVRLAL
jgi:hypothetical protein